MFRPLLGHLQALWENRSNSFLYFNALWDPKCLQNVLCDCEIHKFVYIGMCVAVLGLNFTTYLRWCYTGLFKMIVGVLTTCHTQYTSFSRRNPM